MNGRTNAKNGSGGKAFAAISVTYPVGSTCTCTDGTKKLKLKDTSGQGFFLIPYAGTWTVMCYDGADYDSSENKRSKAVEITSQGQSVSVALSYALILFRSGEGATVEFETAKENNSSITITSDAIITNFTSNNGYQIACITPKIDLTEFTQLSVVANCTGLGSSTDYAGILGVFAGTATATALAAAKNSDARVIAKTYFTVKNGEFDLDITGINGEYKVGIKGGLKSTISEIKLRK